MIDYLYRRFLLPAYKPETYSGLHRYWKDLEAAERRSLAANREQQWTEVQRLVRHAYETTPFYRRHFDCVGLSPSSIKSPEDLRRLPPLTRDNMRNNGEELISSKLVNQSLHKAATGGTTDSPVPLLRDSKCVQVRNAAQLRFDSWSGVSLGGKVLWLWGASVDFAKNPSWRWKVWERHVLRQVWAPTSELNDDVFERYRGVLNSFRPRAIIAYPTPLTMFCEYLLRSRKEYHCPRGIVVTAEPLSREQRQTIESAFGRQPFLQYGARDFGMIASECELHDGLHYNPLAVYLEFVPISDSISEILVTDLTNYAMPMLRYKVGDCATTIERQCQCGRGYPLMSEVSGRTVDNFVLQNGAVVPGISLTNRVLKDFAIIKKLQIVQNDYDDFLLLYVPGPQFTEAQLPALVKAMQSFVGSSPAIRFERVSDIPREQSGKTRLCISHVSGRKSNSAQSANRARGDLV